MQVEIWSDPVCPWCYLGKRRFERRGASSSASVVSSAGAPCVKANLDTSGAATPGAPVGQCITEYQVKKGPLGLTPFLSPFGSTGAVAPFAPHLPGRRSTATG